jgi:hypothetical protein
MAALTAAGPALVHFFDFAQLNSVRTLPYLIEWDRRYREAGLATIGVQAPRFEFGADPDAVEAGITRLGVDFPVAIDAGRDLWLEYGCEGWPSLFLWGEGGVLRWFHFGEGSYRETEEAIQEELRALDALRPLPEPMAPLRPGEAPGAMVIAPTPERVAAGGRPWTSEDGAVHNEDYEAAEAWATVEGEGELRVSVDGEPPLRLAIDGAGLYPLARHGSHGSHSLRVEISPGVAVWSISFAPGPAPAEAQPPSRE